jgi:hypothetical protein
MPAQQTAQVVYRDYYHEIRTLIRKLHSNLKTHDSATVEKRDWAAVGALVYVKELLDEAANFISPVKGSK